MKRYPGEGTSLDLAMSGLDPESPEDLAYDHAMDISASVWTRAKELEISNAQVASAMGVTPGRISQIIKGDQNMTLKTLAKLECALGFRLDAGFRYSDEKHSAVSVNMSYDKSRLWCPTPSRHDLPHFTTMDGGLAA